MTLDVAQLINGLSDPTAYPFPVDRVEVIQTHISVVFLAGPFAYKVKKPVRFDFLDYSTLEKRRYFCDQEVRLNRRMAPDVYLGVVPVTGTGGGLHVEAEGEPAEWAVKMRRLPESATLLERLHGGELRPELVEEFARRLAAFHAAHPGPSGYGGGQATERALAEVLDESRPHIGRTVSRAVHDRLHELVRIELERQRPLLDDRATRGMIRDAHGDLRLDHVLYFPERSPPNDLIAVDCIEFSDRLRYIDPVADLAFLAMDLKYHGRRDLARSFCRAYFDASGDREGERLVPLFTAYRAAVRGAVEGFKAADAGVPEAEREQTRMLARARWLLALGEVEEPPRRPCLVLVAGLPGSGKSTLARRLGVAAGFEVIRSDEVRKELAGLDPLQPTPPERMDDLYSPASSDRTYDECLRRAEALLFEGKRVLVDANFRGERRRRAFLDAAKKWAVSALLLVCRADPEVVRSRLAGRQGDASDADWTVYQTLAAEWEEPGPDTRSAVREIDTSGPIEASLEQAIASLRNLKDV